MAKERILIVEDERDLVLLLEYNLQHRGYEVLSAYDGESGLELARKRRPSLILLDITLPGIDGLEFCRRLRRESRTPILFLTAREGAMKEGLELGGNDYVVKPFSIEDLFGKIQAVLRSSARAAA